MDFHKIWQEQCAATHTIRERFGVENALDYLIGEKLVEFCQGSRSRPRVRCRATVLSSSGVGGFQPLA
jgi:hypothetical protein